MTTEPTILNIPTDHPIETAEDDFLQRSELAKSFARRVLSLPKRKGLVVGVFGPWGSGKTSFINLARSTFKDDKVPVLVFNPWMFSGAEQLVERFFAELSDQLKLRDFRELGNALEEYGAVLTGRLGFLFRLTGIFLRRRYPGLSGHRQKIKEALAKQNKPIVVVVDDVDRLSGSETRDIFKLVRLTASFPNIVYIVACDRQRVETALHDDGVDGRDYLGKIIQLPFDLPEIPRQLFKNQTLESIKTTLNLVHDTGPFHDGDWPGIFEDVIRPLIRNIRDLRRYCVAFHGTADSLGGEVACEDLLALEAVRLFLPDVFLQLPAAQHDLTVSPGAEQIGKEVDSAMATLLDVSDDRKLPSNPRIDAMIEAGKPTEQIIRSLIRRLFPQAAHFLPDEQDFVDFQPSQFLQERRVGHELVLRLYLERVADQDLLDTHDAEQAFALLADREALEKLLSSRDRDRILNVIHHVQHYQDEFQATHAEPASIVLLNLLPDLPRQSVPLLDRPQRLIGSIVVSLLRTVHPQTAREQAIDNILPELNSLSAKVTLIDRVGHYPNIGKKLISEDAAAEFEERLTAEIRAAHPEALAEERNPALVISFAQQRTGQSDKPFTVPDLPKLTFALLQDCQTESYRSSLGASSLPKPIKGLSLRNLVSLYGSNALLRQRILDLVANFDELSPWIDARMASIEEAQALVRRAKDHLSDLQDD